MALHDITKKLRAYTRHPMMGGNVTVQQSIIDEAADEIDRLRGAILEYELVLKAHREHVRRLDVALNGDGAAKQASIVDLVSQFERQRAFAQS